MEPATHDDLTFSYGFVIGRIWARAALAESQGDTANQHRLTELADTIWAEIREHSGCNTHAVSEVAYTTRAQRMANLGYRYSQDTETYLTRAQWHEYYGNTDDF